MKRGCFQDRENEGLHRHVQPSSEKQEPDTESQGLDEPAAFATG